MAKTIEPVRSSHKSVMAIISPSSIACTTTPRHPRWKCCPPLTSTKSATIVVHAIGNSLPMLKLEPISKSSEEDNEAGELDKAEEVLSVVLPADEYATMPLYPGEEALDEPAPLVTA